MSNANEIERAKIELFGSRVNFLYLMYTNHNKNPRNNPRPLLAALGQAFNSWAATSFNTLGLIENKLLCARMANDTSGNSLVCQVRFTG